MSKYDIIHATQVEMLELSDEAMEAVAGGGSIIGDFYLNIEAVNNSYIEGVIILVANNNFKFAEDSPNSNITTRR